MYQFPVSIMTLSFVQFQLNVGRKAETTLLYRFCVSKPGIGKNLLLLRKGKWVNYKFNVVKRDPDFISLNAQGTILFRSTLVKETTH